VLNDAVDRLYGTTTTASSGERSKPRYSKALASLIKQSILHQEKLGNTKRVTEMLEILHKLYPNDTNTLSKLIVHHLKSDPERANVLSQKLPSIKHLAEGVDVDTLETTFGKRQPKAEKSGTSGAVEKKKAGVGVRSDATANKLKKKKKRKVRLPKNYDPTSKPDPERWLPLRERSYYRGKRGKRKQQQTIGKGTQGAMGGTDHESTKSTTTTSSSANAKLPKQVPQATTTTTANVSSSSTQSKPIPNKSHPKKKSKR